MKKEIIASTQTDAVLKIFNKYKQKFLFNFVPITPEVVIISGSIDNVKADSKISSFGSFSCSIDKKTKNISNLIFKINSFSFLSSALLEKVVLYLMCFESCFLEVGNDNSSQARSHWKLCAQNVGFIPPNRTATVEQVLNKDELKDLLKARDEEIKKSKDKVLNDIAYPTDLYLSKKGNSVRVLEKYTSKGKVYSYWVYGRILGKQGNIVEILCVNPKKKNIYGYGTNKVNVFVPKDNHEADIINTILTDELFNLFVKYLDLERNPKKAKPLEKIRILESFHEMAKKKLSNIQHLFNNKGISVEAGVSTFTKANYEKLITWDMYVLYKGVLKTNNDKVNGVLHDDEDTMFWFDRKSKVYRDGVYYIVNEDFIESIKRDKFRITKISPIYVPIYTLLHMYTRINKWIVDPATVAIPSSLQECNKPTLYRGLVLTEGQAKDIIEGKPIKLEDKKYTSWGISPDIAEGFAIGDTVHKVKGCILQIPTSKVKILAYLKDSIFHYDVGEVIIYGNGVDTITLSNIYWLSWTDVKELKNKNNKDEEVEHNENGLRKKANQVKDKVSKIVKNVKISEKIVFSKRYLCFLNFETSINKEDFDKIKDSLSKGEAKSSYDLIENARVYSWKEGFFEFKLTQKEKPSLIIAMNW